MSMTRKDILLRIAKAASLYVVYALMSLWTTAIIALETFRDRNVKGFWTESLASSVGFFYSFLILFSLISVFVLHDTAYRARFVSAAQNTKNFKQKLSFVFRSHEFWIDVLTICVLCVIITPIAYDNLRASFLKSVASGWHFAIFLGVFALSTLLICGVAYCATLNWWSRPKEIRKEIQKKDNLKSWLKQLLFSLFMYLAAAPLLTWVIPFIWSLALTVELLIITLTALIISIVIGYFSVKYLRALYHRRRLMKKLKKALKNGYCRLVYAKDIYRSVFKFREGANICLDCGGQKIYCKLITPLKKRHAVYFGEEGWVTVERHMVMAVHYRSDRYFFAADEKAKKILVINPGALRIYATDEVHNRELQSGDKVMGYYVYRTDNFINGIERKYL